MEKKKCTLCEGDGGPSYKLTNSLKRHMKAKHAGHPDLVDALLAVAHSPKKRCKDCGKQVGNIHQHRLACKPKPTVNPDDNFVKAFRERLASIKGGRCVVHTQDSYVTQLGKFLRFERTENANFNPWDWLRWDETEHVVIRDVSEYLENVKAGTPTQMLMSTVYSKLCEWIEEVRSETRDTNEERFSRRRTSNTLVRKELKKGRIVPRLDNPQPDPATAHLDTNITQRVLDAWRTAYKVYKKMILKRFKQGNFNVKKLGIDKELKARAFLNLAIYLENGGLRPESVRNITCFELKNAKHALVKCSYCKENVVYNEHKVVCIKRERWLKDPEGGDYSEEMLDPYKDFDSDSGTDKPIRWRILVHKGKTQKTCPYVEVFVKDEEFQTLSTMVPRESGDNYQPFIDTDWQRDMVPILKKMVSTVTNGEEIWQRANPEGKPLGSYEFKRLALTKIQSKGGKNKERLMTSLGTSLQMAQNVYDDPRERSVIRSEQLRKYNKASRPTEAIPSAAAPAGPSQTEAIPSSAAPAGPSPQDQSDSEGSESGDNYQKLMRTVAKMEKGFKPDADSDNDAGTE